MQKLGTLRKSNHHATLFASLSKGLLASKIYPGRKIFSIFLEVPERYL